MERRWSSTGARQVRSILAAALAIGASAWMSPAAAQEAAQPERRSTFVFYTENDDWWPDNGTDKNYTNAFKVTLARSYDTWRVRRLGRMFAWVPDLPDCAALVPDDPPDSRCISSALHFGQQFYTPDDISIPDLIPNDRPYAGWLYVGGDWHASSSNALVSTLVHIGVTGPPSFSDEVQTVWHRLVGARKPEGWEHQIGTRLGIVVGHSRRWAFDASSNERRWLEAVPYVGATVGNVMTDAYTGARVKVGWNVSRDWLETGIQPRFRLPGELGDGTPGDFELYLVVDGQGRWMPYNVFIDAAEGHTLTRRYLVADGGVGLGVRVKAVTFSYRVAFVSREYDETLIHDYKALRFAVAFGGN